jgi:hypothetical protein
VANPVIVIVIGGDNGNEVNTAKTKGQMGKKKECKKKKKKISLSIQQRYLISSLSERLLSSDHHPKSKSKIPTPTLKTQLSLSLLHIT